MEGETIFIVLFVVATAAVIAVQRLAVSQVIRQVGDPMIELTLTKVTAQPTAARADLTFNHYVYYSSEKGQQKK
jgi:hypothetical protein